MRIVSVLRILVLCTIIFAAATNGAGIVSIYYPSWVPASSLERYDFSKVDITNYAFFSPNRDGDIESSICTLNEDLITGLVAKSHAAGAKCLLSFVGGSGSSYDPDSAMIALTANPAAQTHLITNLMTLVRQYGFDGLGNDWEPFIDPHLRAAAFEGLMTEIRDSLDAQEAIDGKEYLLTCALRSDHWKNVAWWSYITPATEAITDFFEVMTYNFSRTVIAETKTQMDVWVNAAHIPPQKLLQGTPFYSNCGVWPAPAGFSARKYRDVHPDGFDVCAALPESVSVASGNAIEWLITPMQARELAQSSINQGLGGMMVWELSSDVETEKPWSALSNMRAVFDWNSRAIANREYSIDESADSTAEASIGYAHWKAVFTDSAHQSVFMTDSHGNPIEQGGYNTIDKGVSATLHRPASDSSKQFSAGFNLVMDTSGPQLPFLNLTGSDTLLLDMTFSANKTLTIGLLYPGNQASAFTTITGTGADEVYRIPVASFTDANPTRKRGPFVPANTGIISFQWQSAIDSTPSLPDSADLTIRSVAVNALHGTTPITQSVTAVQENHLTVGMSNGVLQISGAATAGTVSIFNTHGQIISRQSIEPGSGIRINDLAKGLYLIHFRGANGLMETARILSGD